MKPHKHAELIKAWADGHKIQAKDMRDNWLDVSKPNWDEECVYRIKPEPKQKPDVIKTYYVSEYGFGVIYDPPKPILKLTFDGKTGELKQAEVLK